MFELFARNHIRRHSTCISTASHGHFVLPAYLPYVICTKFVMLLHDGQQLWHRRGNMPNSWVLLAGQAHCQLLVGFLEHSASGSRQKKSSIQSYRFPALVEGPGRKTHSLWCPISADALGWRIDGMHACWCNREDSGAKFDALSWGYTGARAAGRSFLAGPSEII